MALFTRINAVLTEQPLKNYSNYSSDDIRNIYRRSLATRFKIDTIKTIESETRLAKDLNVKDFMIISNIVKILTQQSHSKVPFEQSLFSILPNIDSTNAQNKEDILHDINKHYQRYYSTKAPYEYCPEMNVLSSPPMGYKPICVQVLARHGSRCLTSHDYDVQTLKIWQLAKQKCMLTNLGEQLKDDVDLFMHENNHIGRGELTQRGRQEHFAMGNRLFNRLKSLFTSMKTVSVMTSGKKRAVDSSLEFINGLKTSEFNVFIEDEKPNKKLLYFHKSCKKYMAYLKHNSNLKTKLNALKSFEQTKTYARQVLERIYTTEFIELLINRKYEFSSDNNTDNKKSKILPNEVEIVLWLYNMFSVAPAQSQSYLRNMLAKYFTQEESLWFAYINDAKAFYEKGPSIEGTTATYDMSKPLLNDFFSSVDTFIEGNTNIIAKLRFAHAETIIPFASLLKIPNFSDKAVDNSDIYTYENSQWRGDQVSPMAANIQWEIYQHENDLNRILVRMLYNEMEVRFKQECQPITPDSFFYDFHELKRSYANIHLT